MSELGLILFVSLSMVAAGLAAYLSGTHFLDAWREFRRGAREDAMGRLGLALVRFAWALIVGVVGYLVLSMELVPTWRLTLYTVALALGTLGYLALVSAHRRGSLHPDASAPVVQPWRYLAALAVLLMLLFNTVSAWLLVRADEERDRLLCSMVKAQVLFAMEFGVDLPGLVEVTRCDPGKDDFFQGTDGADRIVGTRQSDFIDARDGHDVVRARNGKDFVAGGDGNDDLSGQGGDDVIEGGEGKDFLTGRAGDDTLRDGSRNKDTLHGGRGWDTCNGGKNDEYISCEETKK